MLRFVYNTVFGAAESAIAAHEQPAVSLAVDNVASEGSATIDSDNDALSNNRPFVASASVDNGSESDAQQAVSIIMPIPDFEGKQFASIHDVVNYTNSFCAGK